MLHWLAWKLGIGWYPVVMVVTDYYVTTTWVQGSTGARRFVTKRWR